MASTLKADHYAQYHNEGKPAVQHMSSEDTESTAHTSMTQKKSPCLLNHPSITSILQTPRKPLPVSSSWKEPQKVAQNFPPSHSIPHFQASSPPPPSPNQPLPPTITLAFSAAEKHPSPCCSACTSSGSAASPKSGALRTLSRSSASSCVTVRRYQDGKAAAAAEAGRISDSDGDGEGDGADCWTTSVRGGGAGWRETDGITCCGRGLLLLGWGGGVVGVAGEAAAAVGVFGFGVAAALAAAA